MFSFSLQNNADIPVAIKTYKNDPEKEQEDASRSEKFLEEACKYLSKLNGHKEMQYCLCISIFLFVLI